MKTDGLDRFDRLRLFLSAEYIERRQYLLDKFDCHYPDELACWRYVISQLRAFNLLNCRICGSSDVIVSDDFRQLFCQDCAAESRSTAGTFFHGVRKVRAWLFAIWISEHGFYVSSKWFASAISVSQSSALHIIKSTLLAAERNLDVSEFLEVSLSNLNRFFAKRTILTPAMLKPSQELEDVFKSYADCSKDEAWKNSESGDNNVSDIVDVEVEPIDVSSKGSPNPEFDFDFSSAISSSNESLSADSVVSISENHSLSSVYRSLGSTPLTVDQISAITGLEWQEILAALTELEFDGLVTGLAGGAYVLNGDDRDGVVLRSENMSSEQSKQFEAKAKSANSRDDFFISARCFFRVILDIAHGVSRKYMSLYVACANLLVNGDLDDNFMEICLRTGYLGRKVLRSYITPDVLEFVPLKFSDR